MKTKKVVLFGPPGSGKGTQAELLKERLGFEHYSTGEVFRDHIARRTQVGQMVEQFVTSGRLVPDELVLEVVSSFVRERSDRSIVFDGFPRTLAQAEGLDRVLALCHTGVDLAVLVDLADDEVVKRLTARRQCQRCGKIYNLTFSPPGQEGICDKCGGELYQRRDDSERVIRDRLEVYHRQTKPLIEYYRNQQKLQEIDGSIGRDRVYQELLRLMANDH